MKKIIYLSVACAGFLFASCNSGNKQQNSAEDTTEAEATTPSGSAAANIPGLSSVALSDTIHLTGNDQMHYDQTLFKVNAGKTITLTFKNIGTQASMTHDVTVLQPGTNVDTLGIHVALAKSIDNLSASDKSQIIAHTKMLGPGQEDSITFTLPNPGVYEFMCTYPGHYASMHGNIVAQ